MKSKKIKINPDFMDCIETSPNVPRWIIFLIMMTALISAFILNAQAIEIVRQKNVATKILVPIVDADGDTVTAAAGLDSEFTYWDDGASSVNWTDLTNEMTELQESGWYELSIAQGEMNHDYIAIQTKTSTSGAKTQNVLIRTTVGDPLNLATTDDGGAINVTSGKIDEVATLTGHTAQTGDAYARLGAPAGASVSADIAAVKSDTGAILTDTAAQDTSSELRTLLFGSDTAGATAANQTTIIGYIDTEVAAILEDTGTTLNTHLTDIKGATFSGSTDSLEAIRNRGDAEWITATGFSTHSAADVWDVTLSEHLSAGTTGNALNAAGSAGDPWATALPGAYGAGSAGYIIGSNINAPIATVDTVVDAIKAKTDSLTFTGAGKVDANVVNWKGSAAAAMTGDAYARLGAPAGASVSADIAAVKSDSAAILVDTAAMDTANELRTLLTGGTSALSILTASDNIGINWADVANPTTTVALSGTTIGVVTTLTTWDKTGYALSAAGIDAIWDEVQSGHSTAGSFGLYLDSKVSEAGGGTVPTADEIADQVWDELLSGHAIAGSTGAGLSSASAAGDPWAVDVSTGYTGQAGEYIRGIKNSTDGDKEGSSYSGIEAMIRSNR
jgi:hypothetical protein